MNARDFATLSFSDILALSEADFEAYREWRESQKTEEQKVDEYKEYLDLAHPDFLEE